MQISHDKFFWTAPVAAMAVTSTAKGIAPKFLLLGTAAGQVLPQQQQMHWLQSLPSRSHGNRQLHTMILSGMSCPRLLTC